jgi:hypothetical protein
MAFGEKKTFKQKFNDAAKKVLLWTGLAGAVGGPVAYEYGTIETQTVKVISYQGDEKGNYTLKTDKGAFNIEKSRLHFQTTEDVFNLYWPINNDGTYDIKTYGWHLIGGWQPNIIDVQPVSAEELQKRKEDQAKKNKKDNTATTTTQSGTNNNGGTATTTTGALSGQMITTNVIINGYNVQITIPVEAAGKVTINSVAPVVQTNNNVVPSAPQQQPVVTPQPKPPTP